MSLFGNATSEHAQDDKLTAGDYRDWSARTRSFAAWAYCWDTPYTFTGAGDPRSVVGYQFSGTFFSLLGARPLLGRTLLPADTTPGRDRVVVLSHRLWTSAGESRS